MKSKVSYTCPDCGKTHEVEVDVTICQKLRIVDGELKETFELVEAKITPSRSE